MSGNTGEDGSTLNIHKVGCKARCNLEHYLLLPILLLLYCLPVFLLNGLVLFYSFSFYFSMEFGDVMIEKLGRMHFKEQLIFPKILQC